MDWNIDRGKHTRFITISLIVLESVDRRVCENLPFSKKLEFEIFHNFRLYKSHTINAHALQKVRGVKY